jgi:hypothetical protein
MALHPDIAAPHMFDVFGRGIPAVERAIAAWMSAVGEALARPV